MSHKRGHTQVQLVQGPVAETQEERLEVASKPVPHGPAPSRWPIMMAFAVAVAVGGLVISPLLSIVGVVASLAIAIAWGVEGGHE